MTISLITFDNQGSVRVSASDLDFNFTLLLTLIQALAIVGAFESFANLSVYLAANPSPVAGAAYFDQSLGYAVILLQDGQWHGLQNS